MNEITAPNAYISGAVISFFDQALKALLYVIYNKGKEKSLPRVKGKLDFLFGLRQIVELESKF